MNTMIRFHSVWADEMEQFVAFKRMGGYDYTSQARTLSYFDHFLFDELEGEQPPCLSRECLQEYLETITHLESFSRRARLSSLREFTRYLHAKYPHSALLPREAGPRYPRRVRFFRIEPEQIAELIGAARTVLAAQGIQARSIGVLIGVLYSTGLRIREALALTLADIDAKRSTLHVAKGKFSKQRLVPLSPSTLAALEGYLESRSAHAGGASGSPLFISSSNKALSYCQAYDGFRRLCRHCGLVEQPPPRLHDLRHNYACHRLVLWREEGRDVNAMLPVLATAMGHVNFFHTQIYLHIEPGELQYAATLLRTRLNTDLESKL